MTDEALSNRVGAMETRVGILENSIGNIETAQVDSKTERKEIYTRLEQSEVKIIEKIAELPIQEHKVRIETNTKELNGVKGRVGEVEKATNTNTSERKSFAMLGSGLDWFIKIILAVVALYFSYVALKNGF